MRVAVLVTHARCSLPAGIPWVELPRFLVRSFHFSSEADMHPPSARPEVGFSLQLTPPCKLAAAQRRADDAPERRESQSGGTTRSREARFMKGQDSAPKWSSRGATLAVGSTYCDGQKGAGVSGF